MRKFLSVFVDRFQNKKTTTWAASLAFYTALSLAPLLVLFLSLTSHLSPTFQTSFYDEINSLMGSEAAAGVALIVENSKDRADIRSLSSILSFLALLVSASLIFGELRAALNNIFDRNVDLEDLSFFKSILRFLHGRVLQMGLVLGFLVIMIVSLGVSAMISSKLNSHTTGWSFLLNSLLSAAIYVLLFTTLFRYVPNKSPSWRHLVQGGVLTAFLFVIGKELIGLYLGNSAISSSYGAAGSVVLLLVWVYYSTMIVFVGAHISFILDHRKSLGTI